MSRYTVRVRQADSLHGTFACDSVYVDGGGDLKVNRTQRLSEDLLTIARFQHGHWSSYELEPSDEADAEEQLRLGAITLHEFARRILGEPDADDSTDAPVKAEALPEVGDTVHALSTWDLLHTECMPMRVAKFLYDADGSVDGIVLNRTESSGPHAPDTFVARSHDEDQCHHSSWHWPCGGSSRVTELKPDALAPTTLQIDLRGCRGISDEGIARLARKFTAAFPGPGVHIQL